MIIGITKESAENEKRVAVCPENIKPFTDAGMQVHVQSNAGHAAGFMDSDYESVGAKIISDIERNFLRLPILFFKYKASAVIPSMQTKI